MSRRIGPEATVRVVSVEERLAEMRQQLDEMTGETRCDFTELGAALATAVGCHIASYEGLFKERYPDEDVRETARVWWQENQDRQRRAGLVRTKAIGRADEERDL
ncbi:MAG: hypothetical protein ACYDGR_09815 [Candidatus Dormibacteria bacterium]